MNKMKWNVADEKVRAIGWAADIWRLTHKVNLKIYPLTVHLCVETMDAIPVRFKQVLPYEMVHFIFCETLYLILMSFGDKIGCSVVCINVLQGMAAFPNIDVS